jgi:hypothetical protein
VFGIPKKPLIILGALVAVMLMLSFKDGGGAGASGGGGCEFSVRADVLNVRQSPQLDAPVVGKLTGEEQTQAQGAVRNGFRKIAAGKWASDEFLAPDAGNSC